jgi:phenylpropionate dioxygenase-like ring-hydroxylating dioxygenase large terminal subunit
MLENHWYTISTSKEVNKKPKRFIIFSKAVVVFRIKNIAYCLEDRCLHRNVALSKGKICGDNLQCPYHGWQYDKNGHVDFIPSMGDQFKLNKSIKNYQCVEQDGYIWICIGENPVSKMPPKLPKINDKGFVTFTMKTHFFASTEQCLENFLDCPHAAYVHKFWFRTATNKKITAILRVLEDGVEAEYIDEPREKSLVSKLLLFGGNMKSHKDRFIAPATSRVDYVFDKSSRHYIITSNCTPINETETMVYTTITFKFWRISWLIKLFFKPLSQIIIRQDQLMLKNQYDNIKLKDKANFVLVKSDILLSYINAFRQSISTNSNPPKSGLEKQIEIYL